MVAGAVLLALILLRVALLGLGGALLIRTVRDCPACFHPTSPVRVPWLRWSSRFEWRWCTHCGWKGVSRHRLAGFGPGRSHGEGGVRGAGEG